MKKILLSTLLITTATSAYATGINETKTLPDSQVLSVYERSRPDYEPLGIKQGSFIIKPGAWLDVIYNDNIYASDADEEDDIITVVRPYVGVESDWSRHKVEFLVDGAFGFYGDNTDENFIDYSASLDGRYDIMTKTYLIGGIYYAQKHDERGDLNAPMAVEEPIEYTDMGGYIGFVRRLGKITLDLEANVQSLDYDDGVDALNNPVEQDYRDRMDYGAKARVGYEFVPNYLAFVEAGAEWREYDQDIVSGRDSNGYYAIAGTALDISGKTKGEIYAGYMYREYDDEATFDEIDGIMFGGELLWNVTELTSLIANVSRSIEETVFANYSGYILTSARLEAEHELKRNILLGANVGWDNYDYEGNGINPEMEYDVLSAGLEAHYLINRNFRVGAGYKFEDRDSNVAVDDYQRNIFLVSARVAF